MSVETELRTVLANNATVAGLVGTRIYPVVLPQDPTLPAIVYQELQGDSRVMASGDTLEREGRFQWSYWAGSYAETKTGRAALIGALNGYKGGKIELVEIDGMRDDYDPEVKWYRQLVEARVIWLS